MEFQEILSEGWYEREEQVYVRCMGGGGRAEPGKRGSSRKPGCRLCVICCSLEPSGGTWASSTGNQWPQLPDWLSFPPLGHLEKRHRFLRE